MFKNILDNMELKNNNNKKKKPYRVSDKSQSLLNLVLSAPSFSPLHIFLLHG